MFLWVCFLVPPSLPVIYDGSGAEILSTVGPYIEGSDVLLTCRVSGGKNIKAFLKNLFLHLASEDVNHK